MGKWEIGEGENNWGNADLGTHLGFQWEHGKLLKGKIADMWIWGRTLGDISMENGKILKGKNWGNANMGTHLG